jgi:uncharacterized protein
MTDRAFTAAIVLALGLAIGGGLIGWGFARGRSTDRYVEVKGLAEREVAADLALWPLRFAASANDLAAAQAQITRSTELVRAASQRVSELVSAGVVLSQGGEYGLGGPPFVFTRLNDLKPAMIAEATANARAAADQFARDSGSGLGGIRQANQGVFVILARDQAPGVNEGSQLQKIVRVVSTIQYFLD